MSGEEEIRGHLAAAEFTEGVELYSKSRPGVSVFASPGLWKSAKAGMAGALRMMNNLESDRFARPIFGAYTQGYLAPQRIYVFGTFLKKPEDDDPKTAKLLELFFSRAYGDRAATEARLCVEAYLKAGGDKTGVEAFAEKIPGLALAFKAGFLRQAPEEQNRARMIANDLFLRAGLLALHSRRETLPEPPAIEKVSAKDVAAEHRRLTLMMESFPSALSPAVRGGERRDMPEGEHQSDVERLRAWVENFEKKGTDMLWDLAVRTSPSVRQYRDLYLLAGLLVPLFSKIGENYRAAKKTLEDLDRLEDEVKREEFARQVCDGMSPESLRKAFGGN